MASPVGIGLLKPRASECLLFSRLNLDLIIRVSQVCTVVPYTLCCSPLPSYTQFFSCCVKGIATSALVTSVSVSMAERAVMC